MSTVADPVLALADWFVRHYSADELRIFVRQLPDGAALARALPGAPATLATLAHEAADLLVRHGTHLDPAFWAALETSFPRLGTERAALRERVGAGGPLFPGYALIGMAGRGGSGTVYVARDLLSDQLRAIKVADQESSLTDRERLVREYKVLARLRHPALLTVYHMVQDERRAWMVCEYLEGGTLEARLNERRPLSDLALARLGTALGGALHRLHSERPPMVHRDIKLDNILFDAEDRPRLIDLGHALSLGPVPRSYTRIDNGYRAPELLGPRPAAPGPTTDLYSLCAVLLDAALPDELNRLPEDPGEIRRLLSGRDPRLVEAIIRGCARRPQDRYADAGQLAEALGALLTSELEAQAHAAREALESRVRTAEQEKQAVEAESRAQLAARRRADEAARASQAELARAQGQIHALQAGLARAQGQIDAAGVEANAAREASQALDARAVAAEAALATAQGEATQAREALAKARRARSTWPTSPGALVAGLLGLALGGLGARLLAPGPTQQPAAVAPFTCAAPPRGGTTGQTWSAMRDGSAPMTFVGLSAGAFCMGSPDGTGASDEHPQHPVTVSAFAIGQSEVTQAQWRAVVEAAQKAGDAEASGLKPDPSSFKGDTRPVEQVSWCEAARFANALSRLEGLEPAYTVGSDCEGGGEVGWNRQASGYRLPTEAEWEYAARAGTTTVYATGDDDAALARAGWYGGNSGNQTHAVCTAAEQPWGLCDMAGNVWEWTWDWYQDHYDPGKADGPSGPGSGIRRVFRGGSWYFPAGYARAAFRNWSIPYGLYLNLGFRLVRPSSSPVPPAGP